MQFLELKDKLNSEYSCLCLFGNDNWVKKRALSYVCTAYNVTDDGFSIDYLDAPQISDVVLSCSTPSMFCEKKLVVVTNANFFGNNAKSNQATANKQQLQNLINGNGGFCLVIMADDGKNYEDVSGVTMVDCNHLSQTSVTKWIIKYCQNQGVDVDSACASKIANYCLCDMSRVETETQKLLDYGTVTLDSVEQMVHRDVEYDIFDLSKHISNKNTQSALALYNGLVANGNDSFAIFTLLYNFYRRVYYVKTSSYDNETTAKYLGVKPRAIDFAKEVANKYKAMQLRKALQIFEQTNKKLEVFLDENQVMPLLIMQLANL